MTIKNSLSSLYYSISALYSKIERHTQSENNEQCILYTQTLNKNKSELCPNDVIVAVSIFHNLSSHSLSNTHTYIYLEHMIHTKKKQTHNNTLTHKHNTKANFVKRRYRYLTTSLSLSNTPIYLEHMIHTHNNTLTHVP